MSGFKSWSNDTNGNNQLNSNNSSSNNNTSSTLQQWGETPTTLFTDKEVSTSNSMQSDLGFFTTSDVNLKTNIKDLSNNKKEHLDKLRNLIPKSYNFKNQETTSFGLIAQEVEKIYPELVGTQKDGTKCINYTELIPLLLLQTNNMERKIEELKNNN
jgi:hypothetical protein